MIDLSTLEIPSIDVVPEPTAEELRRAINYSSPSCFAVICGLVRRCRELEAEAKLREFEHGKNQTLFNNAQECQAQRIADLEAEVRLLQIEFRKTLKELMDG